MTPEWWIFHVNTRRLTKRTSSEELIPVTATFYSRVEGIAVMYHVHMKAGACSWVALLYLTTAGRTVNALRKERGGGM